MTEQDQQFVEYIVKALVDHPDDVKTERTVDEMGVLITLHLNQQDMGQVIGRQGQTAKAIRTLLRVVGAKRKARVNLKINEPEGSGRGPMSHDAPHGAPHSAPHSAPSHQDDSMDMDEFKL
ncbi:MAG: hypothetical protein NVSMB66_3600 [Candidatus Doudnabacteria bacterium]